MWKKILKRSGKGISEGAKELIDSVMTTTPKSLKQILTDMYEKVKKDRKKVFDINSSHLRHTIGTNKIPTRMELSSYLRKNSAYGAMKAIGDKNTVYFKKE